MAGGTYFPNVDEGGNVNGDQTDSFHLHAGVTVNGGYNGQSGAPGQENVRDLEVTTFSGDIDNTQLRSPGDSQTVVRAVLPGSGAITVDLVTISGGNADGTTPNTTQWEEYGGGVYIAGGYGGDLTFNDCRFENNYAIKGGGGANLQGRIGSVIFTGCVFIDNEAGTTGGGLTVVNCGAGGNCDTTLQIGGINGGDECMFITNRANNAGALRVEGSAANVEYCQFIDNEAKGDGATGGAISALECAAGKTFTISHCTFDGNDVDDTAANGYGGAVAVKGYNTATFEHSDFLNNRSSRHAAALWLYSEDLEPSGTCYLAVANIDDCKFVNNRCDLDTAQEKAGKGGAIWSRNIALNCANSQFDDNRCEQGGGAIWFEVVLLNSDSDGALTLTNCNFRRNLMEPDPDDLANVKVFGGGAVLADGFSDGTHVTECYANVSGCTFIENVALRGGAIYFKSTSKGSGAGQDVRVDNCQFLRNISNEGAGAICASDQLNVGSTEVLICRSQFVSNTALGKGGAVYNRGGAKNHHGQLHRGRKHRQQPGRRHL